MTPLLEEARAILSDREDALDQASKLVTERDRELCLARQAYERAVIAEAASIAAIDDSIRARRSLAERRRAESAARRANECTLRASLAVESAGERLLGAERAKLIAAEARTAAEIDVKELLRLRDKAENTHRREQERDEERQRENEALDHWRPVR
jgi:hypothetical protein